MDDDEMNNPLGKGGGSISPPSTKRKKFKALFDFDTNLLNNNRFANLANIDSSGDILSRKIPNRRRSQASAPINTSATATSSTAATSAANATPTSTPKAARIPPLTVHDNTKSRADIKSICDSLKIKDFHLRNTSMGITIICNNQDDFNRLKNHMSNKDTYTPFYTHDTREQMEVKYVLKGLYNMEDDQLQELLTELKNHQIEPISIRTMIPNRKKFHDQAFFVLSFQKGKMNLNKLRLCQYLMHHRVTWEAYTSLKRGPTRCHKCQLFGHGSRNCNLPRKCPMCAQPHEMEKCPLVNENGYLNESATPKCANCNGDHPVTSRNCPKLIEYQAIQERINNRSSRTNRRQPAPVSSPTEYPSLPQRPIIDLTAPPPNTPSRPPQGLQLPESSNLLSAEEILQITEELINGLRSCKTGTDQFRIVMRIAVKFLNHG